MTAYTWDMVVDRLFGNLPVQVRFGRPGAAPLTMKITRAFRVYWDVRDQEWKEIV